jgi:hypothetical protein
LVKEFLAAVKVIIFTGIGAAYYHYYKLGILVYNFIAYGRLKQMAVFVNPFLKVKGACYHGK